MLFYFFKQKTAYEMRISDWSSDVCSSDLANIRWAEWPADKAYASWRAQPTKAYTFFNGKCVKLVKMQRMLVLPSVLSRMAEEERSLLPPGSSEERRVGKECARTCRSRWSQDP